MEIKNIYHNRIFSIQFDGSDMDEYNLAFSLWRDIEYLSNYFERNFGVIDKDFWRENNIPIDSLDEIISWVAKDAVLLEKFIKKIVYNSVSENKPDLDTYFKPLDGQYSFVHTLVPSKGYGIYPHSMLRLYAIKVDKNTYIVVHGGIKLTAKISGTPELNKIVFNKIDNVIHFLKDNGIIDVSDII